MSAYPAGINFTIKFRDRLTSARAGEIRIGNEVIETPFFMPVATYGFVKGIPFPLLKQMGYKCVIFSTFHLMMRPGIEKIKLLGGISGLTGWDGLVATDSGGFQIFSLSEHIQVSEDKIEFRSPVDGSKIVITPEKIIEAQLDMGSNFVMPLDVCSAYPVSREVALRELQQTLKWFEKCYLCFMNRKREGSTLFYIIQGSIYEDLRIEAIKAAEKYDTGGYAAGGLGVGEPPEQTYKIARHISSHLPEDKPRYAMGIGYIHDIIKLVSYGYDMFDCVLPTRNGRNGQLLMPLSRVNFRNSEYALKKETFSIFVKRFNSWDIPFCALHHSFKINDMTGPLLASLHNLLLYQKTIDAIKYHIKNGTFSEMVRVVEQNMPEKLMEYILIAG